MNTRLTKSAHESGFTLVEMMITVAVLALVLGLAVPAFTDTIRNNRIASASNELISALTVTRAEAVKRRMNVSVCVRDGLTCSANANNWSQGWLIFTDDLAPFGQIDAPTDVVLLASDPTDTGVQITSGGFTAVTFSSRGETTNATFDITKAGCQGNNHRRLTVQNTGRLSLARRACP